MLSVVTRTRDPSRAGRPLPGLGRRVPRRTARGGTATGSRDSAVWALTAAVAGATALLWTPLHVVPSDAPSSDTVSWVVLAALFAATELLYADILVGRNAQGLSLT